MVDHTTAITDDELHAYADGELAADRLEAVEAWLSNHPEDAARVAGWRTQANAIRGRYGAVAQESVPARLKLDQIVRSGRRSMASWSAVAAAIAVAAFVGGVAGWMAHGASAAAPSVVEPFAAEAMSAHRLYVAEVRHPIEVKAAETHLVPWLSRRVGTSLRAPDLAAFDLKLLGGRLLPGLNGPAALLMYESGSGERVTVYCSRLTETRTALRYTGAADFGAVHWVEGGFGWVVSGPGDKGRLKAIAGAAYEQLDNRTPARSSADQLISRRGS